MKSSTPGEEGQFKGQHFNKSLREDVNRRPGAYEADLVRLA